MKIFIRRGAALAVLGLGLLGAGCAAERPPEFSYSAGELVGSWKTESEESFSQSSFSSGEDEGFGSSSDERSEDSASSSRESSESSAASSFTSSFSSSQGGENSGDVVEIKSISDVMTPKGERNAWRFSPAGADMSLLSFYPKYRVRAWAEDASVIISGSADFNAFKGAEVTHKMAHVKASAHGTSLEANIDFSGQSDGFGMAVIKNANGSNDYFYVKYFDGKAGFPEVSENVKAQRNAVLDAEECPREELLRLISPSGDEQKAAEILENIKKQSDEICKGLDGEYEKLEAIAFWAAENIYYDKQSFGEGNYTEVFSLERTLDKHAGICGSFANITTALAAAQGIEIYNIIGRGISGHCFEEGGADGYHEWAAAVIDGRVVLLDSSWMSHNSLTVLGEYKKKAVSFRYFDSNEQFFAQNHKALRAEHRDYFSVLS